MSTSLLSSDGSTLYAAGDTVFFLYSYDLYYFNVIWQKVRTLDKTSATPPYRFISRLFPLNDKWIIKVWSYVPASGGRYVKFEICPITDIGRSSPGVVFDPPFWSYGNESPNLGCVVQTKDRGVYVYCATENPRSTYNDFYIRPNAVGIFEDTDYTYLRIK